MAKAKKAAPSSKFSKRRRDGVRGISGKSKRTFKKDKGKGPFTTRKRGMEKIRGAKRVSSDSGETGTEGETSKLGAKRPTAESAVYKKQKVSSAAATATKKERRVYRKQQRKDFELVKESKVIWEHLRPHKSSAGRSLAREELMALAQGHFKELVLKHDTARVVQSLLKNGTAQDRSEVLAELRDDIVELSKLKYAKFVIKALLKYCSSTERAEIISCLYGHVRKLIRHAEAAEVVEMAYNDYANLQQRTALIREFYGAEFALFKEKQVEEGEGEESCLSSALGDVLAANPSRCKVILLHMKDSLLPLLNKGVVRHSIVHRALLEYLQHCSANARSEMIECLREKVVNILHTKDGSRVALQCIWHGSAKDRKVIVKSLKGLVTKVCQEENGHLLMLGIFDSVDDTVLVKKVLLSELSAHLQELCVNQYGRRVLLYLLAPRSPSHFSSQFLSLLTPGDGNAHTRKPAETRQRELLEGVARPLLDLAVANAVSWTLTSQHAPLLLEIASALCREKGLSPNEGVCPLSPLYEVLVEHLREGGEGEEDLMQHPCAHWVIKKLILMDASLRVDEDGGIVDQILDKCSSALITSWASSNRGAFVLCALMEVGVAEMVVDCLECVADQLAASDLKGQQALYAKYVSVCQELGR